MPTQLSRARVCKLTKHRNKRGGIAVAQLPSDALNGLPVFDECDGGQKLQSLPPIAQRHAKGLATAPGEGALGRSIYPCKLGQRATIAGIALKC